MLTDSHAHLDFEDFDSDRAEVLTRAREAGVTTIINISLGPELDKFERGHELVMTQEGLFLAVGFHPHDASKFTSNVLAFFTDFIKRDKVVAVGEIGLDYHYERSPRESQQHCFAKLLDFALKVALPVSIHSRDAFEDTYRLTRERNIFKNIGGVLHCFTGTREEAEAYAAEGAYISFSGIVTFKKAEGVREAARALPLNRILIETDSPFLTPEPNRGKRNEPAFVVRVAETIAALKGLSTKEVSEATSANAKRLFRI